MDPVIGALIGTGVGAVGQVMTNKQNQDFAKEQADTAWERQLAMYNRMYKDESPANRVKQLREAGLSKSLMFGGGAGSVGGQAQGASAPKGDTVMSQNPMLGLANGQLGLTMAQIENIKADTQSKQIDNANKDKGGVTYENIIADTAKKLAEKGNTEAIKEGNELQNIITEIEGKFKEQMNEAEINKLYGEIEMMNAGYKKMIAEAEKIGADTNAIKAAMENQNAETASRIALNQTMSDKAFNDMNLTDAQVSKIRADIAIAFSKLKLDWTSLTDIDRIRLKKELDQLDWTKDINNRELEQRIKENIMNYGQKK